MEKEILPWSTDNILPSPLAFNPWLALILQWKTKLLISEYFLLLKKVYVLCIYFVATKYLIILSDKFNMVKIERLSSYPECFYTQY